MERSNADEAEATLGELPASFRGELPCADCAGIRYHLSLFPDGLYTLSTVYLGEGEDRRFHERGQWTLDATGRTLTLEGDAEGPRMWRVRDSATLEMLDLEGREIESSLSYQLQRTANFVTEPLENRYWKLVELDGAPVQVAEQQREPHLVLHAEESRVAGSTGCNRLMGGYRLEGDRLSFGQLATTHMACLNGSDIEPRFLAALEATVAWRVLADRLEFYDAEGKLLARFEVRHLT